MFSASCHYALQAMFYIAMHSSKESNVDLGEIAEEKKIPKHFLSKILQMLVKHKLLLSMRGPSGGFRLSKPPKDICLLEIVEIIDGLEIFNQCGIEHKGCDPENPCPIHDEYSAHRNCVYKLFKSKTLEGFAEELETVKPVSNLDASNNQIDGTDDL